MAYIDPLTCTRNRLEFWGWPKVLDWTNFAYHGLHPDHVRIVAPVLTWSNLAKPNLGSVYFNMQCSTIRLIRWRFDCDQIHKFRWIIDRCARKKWSILRLIRPQDLRERGYDWTWNSLCRSTRFNLWSLFETKRAQFFDWFAPEPS
jgi:hypothetical protein